MRDLVTDSINYIISLMNVNGEIVIKDNLKLMICINYIERANAEDRAKNAFDKHKKKVLQ